MASPRPNTSRGSTESTPLLDSPSHTPSSWPAGDSANDPHRDLITSEDSKAPLSPIADSPTGVLPTPSEPEAPPHIPEQVTGDDYTTHRLLTEDEWVKIAFSLGAIHNLEDTRLVHPDRGLWPPRGMPPGLYRDIVFHRTKYFYLYQFIFTIRWVGMVTQILIGASLTAVGSLNLDDSGEVVTGLAALNTIIAGVLALLHNSGVTEKFHDDRTEFIQVEDYVRKILEGSVVDDNLTTEQIIRKCFDRFQHARQAALDNAPTPFAANAVASTAGPTRTNVVRQVAARTFRDIGDSDMDWRPAQPLSSVYAYAGKQRSSLVNDCLTPMRGSHTTSRYGGSDRGSQV